MSDEIKRGIDMVLGESYRVFPTGIGSVRGYGNGGVVGRENRAPYQDMAEGLAQLGRGPDNNILHVSDEELDLMRGMGGITTNPNTGQPEAIFWLLPAILKAVAAALPAIGATAATTAPALASVAPAVATVAPAVGATLGPTLAGLGAQAAALAAPGGLGVLQAAPAIASAIPAALPAAALPGLGGALPAAAGSLAPVAEVLSAPLTASQLAPSGDTTSMFQPGESGLSSTPFDTGEGTSMFEMQLGDRPLLADATNYTQSDLPGFRERNLFSAAETKSPPLFGVPAAPDMPTGADLEVAARKAIGGESPLFSSPRPESQGWDLADSFEDSLGWLKDTTVGTKEDPGLLREGIGSAVDNPMETAMLGAVLSSVLGDDSVEPRDPGKGSYIDPETGELRKVAWSPDAETYGPETNFPTRKWFETDEGQSGTSYYYGRA